jgi:type IV secretory pathway VirB10-like protein
MKLSLHITASLVALLCAPTHAQTIKCTAPDGKVTYSNVACPDSTQTAKPVDTSANTLDGSALREQAQRDKAAATHVETTQREHAAAEASSRQQAQAQAAVAAKQEAQRAQSDEAAYANCVRDVERQSLTEDARAELFVACRSAGASQRQSGMSESAIRDCVRSVERTGAFPKDKVRQVAMCHGAHVLPEPPVVVLRPSVRPMGPPRITTCSGNQCSDDAGQRYFKQQGTGLVREDGKACQLAAGNTVRCP